jgi:hypothetical protein
MYKYGRMSVILVVLLLIGLIAAAGAVETKLVADDPVPNAQFGRSVAIAGDLTAVGQGGDGDIGAVYLFRRDGQTWRSEAKLEFPDEVPENCPDYGSAGACPEFGRTVAIQGDRVYVGARFAPVGDLKAGAVYVFKKDGDSWQLEDTIVSPLPESGDNFGRALAVQGNLLVVTARKSQAEEGSAYVFAYQDGAWIHRADLLPHDPLPGAYFGQSVAMQGDVIVIGARNANPSGAGAFYVFCATDDGWTEVAKVTPQSGKKNDQYGFSIAISGDVIAVGARRADPNSLTDAGAAYVYSLNEGDVLLVSRLTPADAAAYDEFGQSVAIAGDVILVGAWKDDSGKGSVYLFRKAGNRWVQAGKIVASDGFAGPDYGDEFGFSLAAFGNRLVTGAHFVNEKAGAAYVISFRQ